MHSFSKLASGRDGSLGWSNSGLWVLCLTSPVELHCYLKPSNCRLCVSLVILMFQFIFKEREKTLKGSSNFSLVSSMLIPLDKTHVAPYLTPPWPCYTLIMNGLCFLGSSLNVVLLCFPHLYCSWASPLCAGIIALQVKRACLVTAREIFDWQFNFTTQLVAPPLSGFFEKADQ